MTTNPMTTLHNVMAQARMHLKINFFFISMQTKYASVSLNYYSSGILNSIDNVPLYRLFDKIRLVNEIAVTPLGNHNK
jgi:hypothetical protein